MGAPASPRKPGAPPATATKSPELVSPAAAAAGRGAPGRRRADNGHRPVGLRHPTSPNRPHACTNSGKTAGTATTPPENRGSTGHHNQISRVSVVWPRRRRPAGRGGGMARGPAPGLPKRGPRPPPYSSTVRLVAVDSSRTPAGTSIATNGGCHTALTVTRADTPSGVPAQTTVAPASAAKAEASTIAFA